MELEMGSLEPLLFPKLPKISTIIDMKLLERMEEIQGKEEDKKVNGPMHRLICSRLPLGYQAKLTINTCKLIDNQGREQREDILLLEGNAADEKWTDLVSMVVGKKKLDTNGWKIALGQAMRRAKAILECQPWRNYVIIPITDINSVGFLQVTNATWAPTVSSRVKLFDESEIGPGAANFLSLLAEPSLFGYVKCPVTLDVSSLQNLSTGQCSTLFARLEKNASRRAVFLVNFDSHLPVIVKACEAAHAIDNEGTWMRQLSQSAVPGVLKIQGIQNVTVFVESTKFSWKALVLSPYCSRLRPSVWSQHLFVHYASTLTAAHDLGICHNDISLQNLLVVENDGKDSESKGIVADWGSASKTGHEVTSTTILLAPTARLLKLDLRASPLADLESLYVAVCCVAEEVPWSRTLAQHDQAKMLQARENHRVPSDRKWRWLQCVHTALTSDDSLRKLESVKSAFMTVR